MPLNVNHLYRFEDLELDPARRRLSREGAPIPVAPKAFDVLCYLVANSGRVIPKEELLQAIWPDSFVEENNLPQSISGLRKVLTDRASCIATVPGRGYQFTASVQMEPLASAALRVELPAQKLQSLREHTHILLTETSTQSLATPRRAFPQWPLWVVAAMAVLAVYILARSVGAMPLRITAFTQITHDGHPKFIGGTDGSRIYFTQENAADIAEVSVSGGAVATIPVALQDPWAGDVSPDGSMLLVISEAGGQGPAKSLWSLRAVGGSVRHLANAISATWSPDGERIAYAATNGDVFLMRSDGSDAHRIASPGGYLKSLAWSPNGKLLRFSKEGLLWEMSSMGANLHQLLPGWGKSPTQGSGAWASDGRFYFVADGQIWFLDERHSLGESLPAKPLQLTFGPIVWDRPIPSPNGRRLIASGRTNRGELVRFDAHSGQFQPFLAGISAEFVSFSPDGKSVAYVSYPEGILWRANSDGSNPTQLTEPPTYPKSLRWSPDGAQILFVNRTPQGYDAINIVPADGSGKPRRLLPADTHAETDPSWSPDGRRIAYCTAPNVGASAKSDLRILDLSTGKSAPIPASDGLLVPHWSPDGLTISAMTLDTMGMRLFHLSSGRWTRLDTGPVAFPEWSHDSRFISYVCWTAAPAVLRIRVADGRRERLADLKGARYTGVYSLWMGLDPTDTPLMLRDAGTDDIYALSLEKK